MNHTKISLTKSLLAIAIVGGPLAAQADTNTFLAPSFRGQIGTASASWDVFTNAYNVANNPNGVAFGGSTVASATITQTLDPAAFLTGTGNIYDFGAATGFMLGESAGFNIGDVVLQTRTLGNTLDYSSVFLTYNLGSGPTSVAGTRTALTDATGGDSSMWTWDLSGLGDINNFNIAFNASAASTSFDSAMLDVQAVPTPEPGTMALLALGGISLVGFRHFRRQASR